MVSLKSPIAILGIVIALAIGFIVLSRIGLPIINNLGKSTSDALSNAGKGITDFFDSLDRQKNENNAESLRVDDGSEFFDNVEQSRGSPEDALDVLDPKSETFEQDKKDVLTEDFGITGADKIDILPNGGLSITQSKTNSLPKNERFDFPSFPEIFSLPSAFAEPTPEVTTVINKTSTDRPITLSDFTKIKPTTRTKTNARTTTIKGTSKSQLDTAQEFQVFGINRGNKKVTGVIRETPKDPRKLRVNSNKKPLETASERASRVFEQTGRFVGEGRGFGIKKASEKTRNFNFGTNTSSGLKRPTTGKNSKLRLADRKKLELEKARAVFDSRSISNF